MRYSSPYRCSFGRILFVCVVIQQDVYKRQAMSVLVLNLRKIQRALLRMLTYLLEILAQSKNWELVQ